jgi:Uma2 family endonuclease
MPLAMHVAARFTTEEFLALPEPPPGLRFELLDGDLVTMNAPGNHHQLAMTCIAAALHTWCRDVAGRGLAIVEAGTGAGDDTVFVPDVQWYSADRVPSLDLRPWPVGDLVCEVRSPSTARYDATTKLDRYACEGAREVWLVDPVDLRARILRQPDDAAPGTPFTLEETPGPDDALTSPLLPGFTLPLSALVAP